METRKVTIVSRKHVLGTNHTNKMANQNGLDEIDVWAMGTKRVEKSAFSYRCKTKKTHTLCYN
jgi:hypothetical protein